MRPTKSTMMLQLGTQAPEFSLPDAHGTLVSRSDFVGKPLLVCFLCNSCAYVAAVCQDLALLSQDYAPQGLAMVAINANSPGKTDLGDDGSESEHDEAPKMMVRMAQRSGFAFPYLVDSTQKVAQSYRAACTPDFFLFDSNHKLVYRGQFDGARGTCGAGDDAAAASVVAAVRAVLHKQMPPPMQCPSIGCSIAWRPGASPAYALDDADPSPQR